MIGFIINDPEWPSMYRVQWKDGTQTDMVNKTRAIEAIRSASVAGRTLTKPKSRPKGKS